MRKYSLLLILWGVFVNIQAQNPFAEFGYEPKIATLSRGEYNEFHDLDSIVQIGSVLFNVNSRQIAGFIDKEVLNSENYLRADISTRWISPDPLSEKYYSISPYAYCANNPVKYLDTDGREVVISGALSNAALDQLQSSVGKKITLSMDAYGNLNYTSNTSKSLSGHAQKIANMIDDKSITVHLATTDGHTASTGDPIVGGAFMGNTVSTDEDGNTTLVANQEVNPNVLGTADSYTRTPGKMMMHETTEAYAGAQISQKAGVGVGKATMADQKNPKSVYSKAHKKATPQSKVFWNLYDKDGNKTTEINNAVRIDYYVIDPAGKDQIIHSIP